MLITEVPEFCGAEHILAQRAKDRATGEAVYAMVDWYKEYASKFGTVLNENPSPGNVAGGLLNITIKSLGAIAKAGTTRVEGVVGYAEVPKGHGLWLMQGPGYDQESTPGLVAAGAQVVVFTTGRGTTIGNAIAPVVKLASNTGVHARMSRDLDLSAGGVIDGTETIDAGRRARLRPRRARRFGRGAGQGRGDQAPRVRNLGRAIGVALMRAAVLVAPGRMHVRDVPVVSPGPGEVQLRVSAVGLCGTDFHIFSGHGNYHSDATGRLVPLEESPQILGHEFAGVVEEAGNRVGDLKAGDLVIVDQGRNCVSEGRPLCEYCSTGDSHQCAGYGEHGITGLPGALAECITVPAVNAIRVEGVPRDRAALTEPLACIVHSSDMVERCDDAVPASARAERTTSVRTVLIFGGGPAGLLFTQYLRNALGVRWPGDRLGAERAEAQLRGALWRDGDRSRQLSTLREAVDELTSAAAPSTPSMPPGAGSVFDAAAVGAPQAGHGPALRPRARRRGLERAEQRAVPRAVAGLAGRRLGRLRARRPADDVSARAGTARDRAASTSTSFITHRYHSLDEVPGAFAGAHEAPDYVKGVVELN